jgi:hypothetical protein
VAAGIPAPGDGQPGQARGGHSGGPDDRVALGHPQQPQDTDYDASQHQRADDSSREAPHGRPGPGIPDPAAALDQQRDGAGRSGDDSSQDKRGEHEYTSS